MSTKRRESAVKIQGLFRTSAARSAVIAKANERYGRVYDSDSKSYYYIDHVTGNSSWDSPIVLRRTIRDLKTEHITSYRRRNGFVSIQDKLLLMEQEKSRQEALEAIERQQEHARVSAIRQKRATELGNIASRQSVKDALETKHSSSMRASHRKWVSEMKAEIRLNRQTRNQEIHDSNEQLKQDLLDGKKVFRHDGLRRAALNGDASRVLYLITNENNDVNTESAMGLTPLVAGIRNGCYDVVKILLSHGADVNHRHVKSRRTPYMEACDRVNIGIQREILRYGAYIAARDVDGNDASYGITANSHVDIIHQMAHQVWSFEVSFLFPNPFRNVTLAFALSQLRLSHLSTQRRVSAQEAATSDAEAIEAALVEAKVALDLELRNAKTQSVTLLQKYYAMKKANTSYDSRRRELWSRAFVAYKKLESAILVEGKVIPMSVIEIIFSYCPRHWFDARDNNITIGMANRCINTVVAPTQVCPDPTLLPPELQSRFDQTSAKLELLVADLKHVTENHVTDANSKIERDSSTGESQAFLHVIVCEGENLPRRMNQRKEVLDPFVTITIGGNNNDKCNCTSVTSDPRVADENPVWDQPLPPLGPIEDATTLMAKVRLFDYKTNELAGEATVGFRSMLDQKSHDDWYVLPPTLKQQLLETKERESPARLRLVFKFVHSSSLRLAKKVKKHMMKQDDAITDVRDYIKHKLDFYLEKLSSGRK